MEVLGSAGQPLDSATRAFFEPRFGHDFSRVRVHQDARAAASARAVNALAFTAGHDLVFASGQYAPSTTAGRLLLAHELAHVVQQDGMNGRLRRAAETGRTGGAAEVEDETAAHRIMGGASPVNVCSGGSAGLIQRKEHAGADTPVGEPAEKPLTRAEEVRLSRTSPGEVTGTAIPPTISLFNFAIDSAKLKQQHLVLLAEIADVLKGKNASKVTILVTGHADASGKPAVNDPLSKKRAQAVQSEIGRLGGPSLRIAWFGEDRPVDTNDTVTGRSRNRRADIVVLPKPGVKEDQVEADDEKDDKKKDDEKKDDQKRDDTLKDGGKEHQTAFCERHPVICACPKHPILCLLLGGLIAGIIFCMLNPEICLPDLDGGGKKKKKKKDGGDKKKRACVGPISLPSGELKVTFGFYTGRRFPMGMDFLDNDECECNAGEYRQLVAGVMKRDYGMGPAHFRAVKHTLAGGKLMDPSRLQEDGNRERTPDAYGHRYLSDSARALLPAQRASVVASNAHDDTYSPGREHGCHYKGEDAPGIWGVDSEEHIAIELNFEGGPVDVSDWPVERRLPGWHKWWMKFERKPPPKPEPTPSGGGGIGPQPASGGGGAVQRTTPRPYSGPIGSDYPCFYLSGLGADPVVGKIYTIAIGFTIRGESFVTDVEVEVTALDPASDRLEVTSTNAGPLNVAPPGHEPILVRPKARGQLSLGVVRRRGGMP